jgi:predicted Zn-dependent peptidase
MFEYKVKTLNNGLKILMVPSKESLSFQFTIVVNTGSDFENKQNNGISHFLEHLCFKGTEKRKNNYEISKELDSIGAYYNAFTTNELTGYFTRVAANYFEKAIDVVSDIYLNSRFPEEEIEKERGVILEEIKMYHDDPKTHVRELWAKLLFGDQPAGWPISGFIQNVKKIKRENLITYRERQYRSKSTLIILSGNFKEKQVIDLIKKYFKTIKKGKAYNKQPFKQIKTPQVLLEYRPLKQTNFVLGTYGINVFDKRQYALSVFNAIFDGGMSGKLYQLVREKLGAAYYINSTFINYSDHGEYEILGGIDSNKIFVIKEILKEIIKFTETEVSQKE